MCRRASRSLKTKHAATIGLLVPSATNPYIAEMARGVKDSCAKNGHCVFICDPDDESAKQRNDLRVFQEKRIDGRATTLAGEDSVLPHSLATSREPNWKIDARATVALRAGAPIDAELVHALPARLPFDSFFRVLVELEIAFRFAYALPPRTDPYARDEVLAAIGGMAVALDVVDSRFAQWPNLDPLAQLADAQNNGALIVRGMEP
jgi:hypothetical protein